METVNSDPFAQALEAGRSRYNALFAVARMGTPRLNPEAFLDHLRTTVQPIIVAIHRHDAERVAPVLDVLYELSLDLVGRGWMGPQARYPHLSLGWRSLFVEHAAWLAAEPRTMATALTNALYNLAQESSTRPVDWIDGMVEAGKHAADLAEWLEAGTVLAWRCGLAPYREGALETAARLNPALAATALGAEATDGKTLSALVDALKANPWLSPDKAASSAKKKLRLVSVCGGFRGTGGPFLTPPSVSVQDGNLVAWDRTFLWELHADAFGTIFHRLSKAPEAIPPPSAQPFTIDESGTVRTAEQGDIFPALANPSTAAATETTLAVTLPDSHFVYLIGLVPDGEV